jgi:hypothetical protein
VSSCHCLTCLATVPICSRICRSDLVVKLAREHVAASRRRPVASSAAGVPGADHSRACRGAESQQRAHGAAVGDARCCGEGACRRGLEAAAGRGYGDQAVCWWCVAQSRTPAVREPWHSPCLSVSVDEVGCTAVELCFACAVAA